MSIDIQEKDNKKSQNMKKMFNYVTNRCLIIYKQVPDGTIAWMLHTFIVHDMG